MNTMQQEFDAVVAHLYKQGRPAKIKGRSAIGGSCKYRYDDGGTTLMCAVGCRIPDDKYDPRMDTLSATDILSIVDVFADVLPPEISEYKEMFAELQRAHDFHHESGFDFGTLEIDLKRIARQFDLTFTKPEDY